MSLTVTCRCGTTYELKDEFANRLVTCPQCGATNRVPAPAPAASAEALPADPVFGRDVFLLRQQLLKISEKYDVCDEDGNKIVFVERPAHLLQNVGALLAGIAAAVVVFLGLSMLAALTEGSPLETVMVILALIGFPVVLVLVAVALSAKRHVTFYRDQSKRTKLLEVLQDRKFQPITATYSVRDPAGQPLARLRKNYLYNLFRKRWYVDGPFGGLRYMAREDSLILSLLRRILGPFFGLLRTNYLILRGETEHVLGEFNRKLTILDRYVLDLRADRGRTLDRRIALALGVMLDTGERR
ncbi:MAG TPA: hypothetical protein VFH97_05285 [Gemmatimonadales bacterium]|jgi:uncharacterized protein YxjI|nr:hypothetical protein [Gemmatimonadales bacterium]